MSEWEFEYKSVTKATHKVCHQCRRVVNDFNRSSSIKGKNYCLHCNPINHLGCLCMRCKNEYVDPSEPVCEQCADEFWEQQRKDSLQQENEATDEDD